ncbi:hypothetical protein [Brevibacillus laterosporus]|uniref:hypothetical protein n=1 Tax=Brevibacillus laterosporus TaxID=1465 RepID=UPI00265CAE71|nr:hypothetical protein [Brevibacillus laterosporus]
MALHQGYFYAYKKNGKVQLMNYLIETCCLSGANCLPFHDDALTVVILSGSISFVPKECAILQFLFHSRNQSFSLTITRYDWPQAGHC